MLRPILGVLFLSLVVTFCMLCLINILSLNCFCAINHILIFFYYFYSLSPLVLSMEYSIVSKGEEKLFTSQCTFFFHVNKAGTSPSYDECDSWLFSQENRGKVEPKEIPGCLLPCLFVIFIWQLDILVTALIKSNMQRKSWCPHISRQAFANSSFIFFQSTNRHCWSYRAVYKRTGTIFERLLVWIASCFPVCCKKPFLIFTIRN